MTYPGRSSRALGASLLSAAVAASALFVGTAGCGSSEGEPLRPTEPTAGTCPEGKWRTCYAETARSDTTLTCRTGAEQCVNGAWGPCVGGSLSEVALDPRGAPIRPNALSSVQSCNNDCNPNCQRWVETPATPYGPTPGAGGAPPVTDWIYWTACDPADPTCDLATVPAGPTVPGPCAHGFCVPGTSAGLDPTCHPCVNTICTLHDPTCCNTAPDAWDAGCRALVYTVCGGMAEPPTDSICDWGVAAGAGFTFTNPNTAAPRVGPIMVDGDFDVGNDAKFYGISATGKITTGARIDILGSVNAAGDAGPFGDQVRVHGNVWSGNIVHGSGNPGLNALWMDGRALAVSSYSPYFWCPAGIGPSCTVGAPPQPPISFPTIPTRTVTTTTNDVVGFDNGCSSNTPKDVAPGDYGSLTGNNGPRIRLTGGGIYNFTSISLTNNGCLVVPCGLVVAGRCTAKVEIRASGSMTFGNEFHFISADPAYPLTVADATRLVLYSDSSSSQAIKFDHGAELFATIIVPNGGVEFGNINNGEVGGLLWAKGAVEFGAGAAFDSSSISTACEAQVDGVGGTITAGACPVDNVVGGARAPLQTPCLTGEDCQGNTRCMDVHTKAACAHDKCTAGAALDPACDPCVQAVCAADAACCTDWPAACVALVPTVCDASCGGTGAGTCTKNAAGYVDPAVSGADLAAGVPCGTTLPVCNHGALGASGTLKLEFWAGDALGIYTSAPNAGTRLGECETSVIVPSGTCVDVDLAATSLLCTGTTPKTTLQDYAVRINSNHALAEASLLDNWTLFRPGKPCANICHPGNSCATQVGGTVVPVLRGTTCDGNVGVCLNTNELALGGAGDIDAVATASFSQQTFTPSGPVSFQVVARPGSSHQNAFGWYEVKRDGLGNPILPPLTDLHVIIDCSVAPGAPATVVTLPAAEIGFFVMNDGATCTPTTPDALGAVPSAAPTNLFYTQIVHNPSSELHSLVWQSSAAPGAAYLGWEDRSAGIDNDFDDLVIFASGLQGFAPTQKVYTERYRATCAGVGQRPKWAFVTWDTVTPATSFVKFEWRAADSAADLDALNPSPNQGYTDFGVRAEAAHPVCNPFTTLPGPVDDPECPVILSDTMSPAELGQEWIDVRMSVDPNGPTGAGVKLNSWEIYFDCLDSQ